MPQDLRDRDEEAAFYEAAVAAYAKGDAAAGEALATALGAPLRREARIFLGEESADVDDVVQDTLVAVLLYLRRSGGFSGNLVKFAVTVARNRCRNLLNWRNRRPHMQIDPILDWLEDTERSPLDVLLDDEVISILQDVLSRLSSVCRAILSAFYLEDVSMEEIRRRIGLRTVQGVYYRRTVCLEQAYRCLKRRLAICSSDRNRGRERGARHG